MTRLSRESDAILWIVVALCLLGADCRNVRKEDSKPLSITIDRATDRISIRASGVPRFSVLAAIESETGIEVRPQAVENESIDVDMKDVLIVEAVEAILPTEARYVISPGPRELVIPNKPAVKDRTPPQNRPGLPRKEDATSSRLPPTINAPPGSNGRGGPGVRPHPRGPVPAQPGRVKKKDPTAKLPEKAVHLLFRVRANGELDLLRARKVKGGVVATPHLRGPFIYVLGDADRPAAFGSLGDPFTTRSYNAKGDRHTNGTIDRGIFGVWVPADVTSSTAFRLYDARGIRLPKVLTRRELPKVVKSARPFAKIDGRAITQLLLQETPPNDDHEVTPLLVSGAGGEKENLVFVGDGFTKAEQDDFDAIVDGLVNELFHETRNGVYREVMNAFNVYRVNAESQDSGITTGTGPEKDTYFHYRFNAESGDCHGLLGTPVLTDDAIKGLDVDLGHLFVILNIDRGNQPAACVKPFGGELVIARSRTWQTAAHEMGHLITNLGDEYENPKISECTEPVNWATNLHECTAGVCDASDLKWVEFVRPGTAVPTNLTAEFVGNTAAGAFRAGTGTQFCPSQPTSLLPVYRPTDAGRMRDKTRTLCPVCYHETREFTEPKHEHDFLSTEVGNFDSGNTRGDVVVHSANSLALYLAVGGHLEVTWVRTRAQGSQWQFSKADELLVGDFDGDGIDDLFVLNMNLDEVSVPAMAMLKGTGSGFEDVEQFEGIFTGPAQSWSINQRDRFEVADFNGDGKDDLIVVNTEDHADAFGNPLRYLGLLQSTGSGLTLVQRFDGEVSDGTGDTWTLDDNDQLLVASFGGDTMEDLYIFNGANGQAGRLGVLRSTGDGYKVVAVHDTLDGWGTMRAEDKFIVADFDGDLDQVDIDNDGIADLEGHRDDLYIFNGQDWNSAYLQMLRNDDGNLQHVKRYASTVDDYWTLLRGDEWKVGDLNGDGLDDLYVLSATGPRLGMLISSGSEISDGAVMFSSVDTLDPEASNKMHAVNFSGGQGWDDVIVYNADRLSLLRSAAEEDGTPALKASRIYPRWIHNHDYHEQGWW